MRRLTKPSLPNTGGKIKMKIKIENVKPKNKKSFVTVYQKNNQVYIKSFDSQKNVKITIVK